MEDKIESKKSTPKRKSTPIHKLPAKIAELKKLLPKLSPARKTHPIQDPRPTPTQQGNQNYTTKRRSPQQSSFSGSSSSSAENNFQIISQDNVELDQTVDWLDEVGENIDHLVEDLFEGLNKLSQVLRQVRCKKI